MIALLLWFACAEPPAPAETVPTAKTAELPESFGLGKPATAEQIAALDVEVSASWAGLPAGRGSVDEGKKLYAQKCAACHAPDAKGGEGWIGPKLVATEPLSGFEKDWKTPKSIGNWWPHASTLWDYVHRSMPQTAPGSLTADETYALVAYLLAENKAVPGDFVADPESLKAVKMPTQVRFVPDDREKTAEFR
jgi:mono/diheme cytochrome c family protein